MVSKNSKKGSKPTQFIRERKEKVKSETIMIEVTTSIAEQIKDSLCEFNGKPILNIIRRYGKSYLVLPR